MPLARSVAFQAAMPPFLGAFSLDFPARSTKDSVCAFMKPCPNHLTWKTNLHSA